MPAKRYRVSLSVEEQQELKGLVSRGRTAAYKQTHARIMLLSDENQERGAMKDEEIARVLRVGDATVGRVRRRCVEEGVEAAWDAGSRSTAARGSWTAKAHLTHLAEPPEGAGWTLQRWLTGWCRDGTASAPRRCAKKNELKPWLKECRCIPPKANASSSVPWRTC